MLVAFNRFYPPELGDVEQRTATPDRSHNETWDALVTTGLLGLVAYLALFASVFYYGLKWLGLIQTTPQRNLFIGLYAGGGLAGAAGMVLWRGLPFFGVGLPFGIILGLIAYLTILALSAPTASGATRPDPWRATALIALVAAVMAHFVEIHFSISIAVSHTLFWMMAALMIVLGQGLVADWDTQAEARPREEGRRRRSSRQSRQAAVAAPPTYMAGVAGAGILGGLLSVAMFDYVTNPYHLTSGGAILWRAFTTLPQVGGVTSYAMMILIGLTWMLGGLLLACEAWPNGQPPALRPWAIFLGVALGVSLGLALIYGLWLGSTHARVAAQPLTSQSDLLMALALLNSLVTSVFVFGLAIMLALGWLLPAADRVPQATGRPGPSTAAWLVVPAALVVIVGSNYTNLRIVHADVIFKTADSFSSSNNWPVATRLYQLASQYAPNEDYYNLFVGKGFLQVADSLTDPTEQANLFAEAEQSLLDAQRLNPLNTDHTANLARLYRWWASVAPTAGERQARAEKSDAYYQAALSLSPHSVLLWNEWAGLRLAFLNDSAGGLERINHSLELDPKFDRTWALLGDYYVAQARATGDTAAAQTDYAQAADAYNKAVDLAPDSLPSRLALGAVYSSTGQLDQAITWYGSALQYTPPDANPVNVYTALAQLYSRSGSRAEALNYAQLALSSAPDDMKPQIQEMIQEIQAH
jgi:tetratricopeptide (TPR) repeat protein